MYCEDACRVLFVFGPQHRIVTKTRWCTDSNDSFWNGVGRTTERCRHAVHLSGTGTLKESLVNGRMSYHRIGIHIDRKVQLCDGEMIDQYGS